MKNFFVNKKIEEVWQKWEKLECWSKIGSANFEKTNGKKSKMKNLDFFLILKNFEIH